jgi:hypothetical protein
MQARHSDLDMRPLCQRQKENPSRSQFSKGDANWELWSIIWFIVGMF